FLLFFFFQAEDGIRDFHVTGVQTCALPIFNQMKLSAYISFILLLLAVACHSNHPEVSPQHSSALADSTWANHLTQKISLEELPVDVKEEIYNDEILDRKSVV